MSHPSQQIKSILPVICVRTRTIEITLLKNVFTKKKFVWQANIFSNCILIPSSIIKMQVQTQYHIGLKNNYTSVRSSEDLVKKETLN